MIELLLYVDTADGNSAFSSFKGGIKPGTKIRDQILSAEYRY